MLAMAKPNKMSLGWDTVGYSGKVNLFFLFCLLKETDP